MPPKRVRAKNWVFTLNNYTPEDENRLKEMDCVWLIYGHETAPETGTQHLQGAICFAGKRDFNALQKLFSWHLEVMRGNPQDSKTYCTKEDPLHYFESGEMPEYGRKKGNEKTQQKWADAISLAKEAKWDEIMEKYPGWWVQHESHFKQIFVDTLHDDSMKSCGDQELKKRFLWIWGPTGTGKSHTAYRIAEELGCPDPYLKDWNKWWDNYKCQKVTIIEEADEASCERLASRFKKWCDKWSFTAEGKGVTFEKIRPQYIIVTSNYPIDVCFPKAEDNEPIHRRMTEIALTSREHHIYWPLTQPEWEEERKRRDGLSEAPGNTIPGPLNASPGIEPPPSQPPFESEEIEDFEEEEERVKRRKCIEDAE